MTEAHTKIPHRQMPTVINAYAKNTHTDNCSHGKKPTRTHNHRDKSSHGQIPTWTFAHMYKCSHSQYYQVNTLLIKRYVHAMK
jgi:hypothetical protein